MVVAIRSMIHLHPQQRTLRRLNSFLSCSPTTKQVARQVGGEWLAGWIVAAAAVSTVGLYLAEMSGDGKRGREMLHTLSWAPTGRRYWPHTPNQSHLHSLPNDGHGGARDAPQRAGPQVAARHTHARHRPGHGRHCRNEPRVLVPRDRLDHQCLVQVRGWSCWFACFFVCMVRGVPSVCLL